MIESYTVHKISCICGRKEAVSVTGLDEFWNAGWSQENIFGEDFDLCPDCVQDLKTYLYGEGNHNADDA
jgi:hypothetical protein